MKPIDATSDSYAEYNEYSNKTQPKFELVIMSGYRNTNIFLLKDTFKICQKKFLLLAKLKIQYSYIISDVNDEPITGNFYEKKN